MDTERLKDLLNKYNAQTHSIKNRNDRVMIIDGLNMFIRAFSVSPLMVMGDHIGGLVGFIRSMFAVINKFKPTRCIVVFDGVDGSKNRRKIFPEYKAGRKNRDRLNRYVDVDGVMDESASFRAQLGRLDQYLQILPVTTICIDHIEADDVISYITKTYYKNNDYGEIIIVSSDRDFYQLIDDDISVYAPTKKKIYNAELLKSEFNISPKNYLTFRTLTGDVSDNIRGVKGVGLKTLLKLFPELIERDIDAEELIKLSGLKIEEGQKQKIFSNIIKESDKVKLNWDLMQLMDVDIPTMRATFIRKMMDNQTYKLDKRALQRLIYDDELNDHFKYLYSTFYSTLTQLDSYAGNVAG